MMNDPNFLLAVLSVVWVITVGLFVYIVKTKDNTEISLKQGILDIKELINGIRVDMTKVSKDLENNVHLTRQLSNKVDKHNDLIKELEVSSSKFSHHIEETNRRLTILEKLVHNKEEK